MQKQADIKTTLSEPSSIENLSQRSSIRYLRKDLKVFLSPSSLFKLAPFQAKLIDISASGLQVVSTRKLKMGKKLSTIIYFPDGYKFEINGKIVRHNQKQAYLDTLNYESIGRFIGEGEAAFSHVHLITPDSKINVKYKNLTDTSIQLLAFQDLSEFKKLTLCLSLCDGNKIEIEANLIRHRKVTQNFYGIKFDKKNQLLGDYLFKTQKSLDFG